MKRIILPVIVGAALAFAVFISLHKDAVDELKFRLGLSDSEALEQSLYQTIDLFNSHYATFFGTGGDLTGLNEFPAVNMVKRRVFQEIDTWKAGGKVLAYDKFEVVPTGVEIVSSRRAVVVTREVWSLFVRDREKRSSEKGAKSLEIQVRYIMGKAKGRWTVQEYEVYGKDDELPPLGEVWSR